MTDIHKKISELNSKYGNESSEFEEELTEHLKNKFPEQYKLSLEDLKNDGSDDPEMEMTPGRFVDHIGDKGEEFLKEYESILRKLSE
mgnify:CR=1 FL=1